MCHKLKECRKSGVEAQVNGRRGKEKKKGVARKKKDQSSCYVSCV